MVDIFSVFVRRIYLSFVCLYFLNNLPHSFKKIKTSVNILNVSKLYT